jgi:hypothetical protein
MGSADDILSGDSLDAAFVAKPVRPDDLLLKLEMLLVYAIRLDAVTEPGRCIVAEIRSQRTVSVILALRFDELCRMINESYARNLELRRKTFEIVDQLQQQRARIA